MPDHRLRRGHAPAALVLALATAAACGPAEDAATTSKTGSAPAASSSASAAPASNGVEKLDGAAILARARKATASARALRVRGTSEEDGEKYAFDFRYAGKTKASGWFRNGAQRVEIIRVGKDVYLKGNKAFLKTVGGKRAVQLLAGKQMKTTVKSAGFKELSFFTDSTAIFDEAVKAGKPWKKGKAGMVGGTPTISLVAATGDEMQVATRGAPYVLTVDGGPGNRIEYLPSESPADIRRPPAGTVVDVDGLK